MRNAKKLLTVLSGGAGFLTPAQFGNQTGHWDSSLWATQLYTDAGSTLCTAENDLVYRRADTTGNGRHCDQATAGARGLLKLNVQNGKAGVLLDGTDDHYACANITQFFSASVKMAFLVFKVVTIGSDSATVYANDCVIGDGSTYWGVHMRSSGPMYHYNYDTGAKNNTSTIANGEACVVAVWHTGGNISMSKNGGAADEDASGNTGAWASGQALYWGRRASTDYSNIYLLEESLHSAVGTAASRASVIAGLKAKWGIT